MHSPDLRANGPKSEPNRRRRCEANRRRPDLNAPRRSPSRSSATPNRGAAERERGDKFAELHRELCRAYDLETILVRDDSNPNGFSGASAFDDRINKIILHGRLSVVTYLFCFGCAIGGQPRASLAFAVAIFTHYFPRSLARCEEVGGMLDPRDWYQ